MGTAVPVAPVSVRGQKKIPDAKSLDLNGATVTGQVTLLKGSPTRPQDGRSPHGNTPKVVTHRRGTTRNGPTNKVFTPKNESRVMNYSKERTKGVKVVTTTSPAT